MDAHGMIEPRLWMAESEPTDEEEQSRAVDLVRQWTAAVSGERGSEVTEQEAEQAESVIRWMLSAAEVGADREVAARLDELSQMILHELKNPLSQVQIGVEMLAKRAEILGDEERTYLGWMQRGVARAAQVLDDVRVLGLAEATQGGSRWVAIPTVVQGVLGRVREEAERLDVECGVEGELPVAKVDGAQVGMALGNFVANAVKYSDPAKPRRWVRVKVERVTGVVEGWRFSVSDNGLGIPARLQREVFRRHFRGHPGAAEGMGLGLSIARQVIERRNGHIWFHSEERKGTVFHFVIPDQPDPLADPAEDAAAAPAPDVDQ